MASSQASKGKKKDPKATLPVPASEEVSAQQVETLVVPEGIVKSLANQTKNLSVSSSKRSDGERRIFVSIAKWRNQEPNFTNFLFYRICKGNSAVVMYYSDLADEIRRDFDLKQLDENNPSNVIKSGCNANQFSPDVDSCTFVKSILDFFESCGFLRQGSYRLIPRDNNYLIIFERSEFGKHPVKLIHKIRALLNGYEYEEGKHIKLFWAKSRPRADATEASSEVIDETPAHEED